MSADDVRSEDQGTALSGNTDNKREKNAQQAVLDRVDVALGRGVKDKRNFDLVRRECLDRERWKLFCRGHPLVRAPRSRH